MEPRERGMLKLRHEGVNVMPWQRLPLHAPGG
jgi:hypothetical protein